jgi:hypothetical protein
VPPVPPCVVLGVVAPGDVPPWVVVPVVLEDDEPDDDSSGDWFWLLDAVEPEPAGLDNAAEPCGTVRSGNDAGATSCVASSPPQALRPRQARARRASTYVRISSRG